MYCNKQTSNSLAEKLSDSEWLCEVTNSNGGDCIKFLWGPWWDAELYMYKASSPISVTGIGLAS